MRFWELPRIEQYHAIRDFQYIHRDQLDLRYDIVLIPAFGYTARSLSDLRVQPGLIHKLQSFATQATIRALLALLTLEPFSSTFKVADVAGIVFERYGKPELVLANMSVSENKQLLLIQMGQLETCKFSLELASPRKSWWPWILGGLVLGAGVYGAWKISQSKQKEWRALSDGLTMPNWFRARPTLNQRNN